MTKKTIILRNFFTVLIIVLVCILTLSVVICAALLNNYTTETITEKSYFDSKSAVVDTDVNKEQLDYTLKLCNSAITEKTGETIIDSYIVLWDDNGLLTFTFFYYSDNGFFKVPTSGNTNKLACLIYNYNQNSIQSFFDIKYEGKVLNVTEELISIK